MINSIMSEQDIERLAGQMIFQKAADMKRKAAIEEELNLIEKGLASFFRELRSIPASARRAQLEPFAKFLNPDALIALLEERDTLQARIFETVQRLRAIGAE